MKHLYRLRTDDVSCGAGVLARAFAFEPLFAYALPDAEKRVKRIPYFMEFDLRHVVLYGEAYAPTHRLEAIAGWLPSTETIPSYRAMVRSGLPYLLLHAGPASVARVRRFEETFAAMWRRHIPSFHWVLDVLGTDPDHGRRGHASMLLTTMLGRLDSQGLPATLGTSREVNVRFYTRFGFEVVDRTAIEGTGITAWLMLRPPTRAQANETAHADSAYGEPESRR